MLYISLYDVICTKAKSRVVSVSKLIMTKRIAQSDWPVKQLVMYLARLPT